MTTPVLRGGLSKPPRKTQEHGPRRFHEKLQAQRVGLEFELELPLGVHIPRVSVTEPELTTELPNVWRSAPQGGEDQPGGRGQ